jgi:DNA-binding NtrC family response regulator
LPDLSAELEQEIEADAVPAEIEPAADYKTTLELVDATLLRDALDRNAWSIRSTARKLGISKTTLKARMAKYGIVP